MTSSASSGDDLRQAAPPTPAALARWLLTAEAGQQPSAETLAAAGERAYIRLRTRLAVLLGTTGFDALWARAIHLAQPEFRSEDDTAVAELLSTRAYGLQAVVRERDLAVVQQNLSAAFASFITLLYIFIGDELGVRFIHQLWPDFPPDAAGSRAEESLP